MSASQCQVHTTVRMSLEPSTLCQAMLSFWCCGLGLSRVHGEHVRQDTLCVSVIHHMVCSCHQQHISMLALHRYIARQCEPYTCHNCCTNRSAHVQTLSTSRRATLGLFDFMPVTAAGSSSPHQNTTPASIHEALHSLLQGASQPALVPLLASRQAPCVQRMCDLLELYSLLRETNAASIQFLMQPGLASTTAGAVPTTAGASRPPFSTEARSDGRAHATGTAAAAATLQQGARKVVLAMVEKVSLVPRKSLQIISQNQ